MSENSLNSHFKAAMLVALEETFENVHGIYLDGATSLFETLATISAEEASVPVSSHCASLAAQVAHVRYYMDVLLKRIAGENPDVDWNEIWQTVEKVSPEEWEESQQQLRETYNNIRNLAQNTNWENEGQIRGALGILMHNAYHLGEIRQALCTIKG